MVTSQNRSPPAEPFDTSPFRALYPWQGNWLEVQPGVRMHYLDEGAGEPILMLHGNPTWSFYWRALVGELSKSRRVIAPDHVGCGLSDKPGDADYAYVVASRVRDLETLVDQRGHLGPTDKLTLVLHDWGGMIGLSYAVRHPEKIARLVITNTSGFALPPGGMLPWQINLARHSWPFRVAVRGLNAFVRGAIATCSKTPGAMTAQVRGAYLAPHDSWANRISVQRFVDDIPLQPEDASWGAVDEVSRGLAKLADKPTLLLWGERDFVFDRHFLAEWRRRLPRAQEHLFPDAGHWLLEDAPEQVTALVRAFLDENPLRSAP